MEKERINILNDSTHSTEEGLNIIEDETLTKNNIELQFNENGNGLDDINFEQYLKFTWVPNEWNDKISSLLTFRISKIEGNTIYCVVALVNPPLPPCFNDLTKYSDYAEINMQGVINNNRADLAFKAYFGEGNMGLEFIDANVIEATITYKEKNEYGEELEEGTYYYKHYNILDDYFFTVNKKLIVETKLDTWGDVKIISGKQEGNHEVPLIYLTNREEDILYQFGAPYQHDSSVKKVYVEELNNDELIDIKVITSFEYDPNAITFEWNFYQLENGWFYLEKEDGDIP